MIKDIFKDKFLGPILLVLFLSIYSLKKTNDYFFLFILLLVSLAILCLVFYFRNDLYIQNLYFDSELIEVECQKGFSKSKTIKFSLISKSIESVDFCSKSFLDSFHSISIRYLNEEGLYEKQTFKSNDDKEFIELIYKLKDKI